MNETTVYAKTPAGQEEIGARKAGLDVRQRRLLILVDGQRSAAQLRGVSGLPDALAMLQDLQSRGLVAANGQYSAAAAAFVAARSPAPAPTAGPAVAATPVSGDIRERGRRAAHAVTELLGPMGEDFALKLESVKSAEALDELLGRCRRMLGDVRGKSALERFERLLQEG